MKKLAVAALVAMIGFSAQNAMAKNVWRECGIGGMIFTKTGWAAITSNIIWDWGTTATSSNISSDGLCEGPKADTARYIHDTYATLEEQTATGGGEHVETMLTMMGCQKASQPAMIQTLRTDLQQRMAASDFAAQTEEQKAESYYNDVVKTAQAQTPETCKN